MMLRTIVAVFVVSVGAALAQYEPPLQPLPAFDPAQQTLLPPPSDGTCACTMDYNPVCGRTDDGARKSFPNECQALCEKAEIVALGTC